MSLGARSVTSVLKLERAEQIERALDLKREGKSIREIATELGCSVGKAHQLVADGIATIPAATRDALVHEVLERESAIVAAHWEKRHDPESAKVIQASDKILMDLFGLKAKQEIELSGSIDLADAAAVADRIARLAAAGEAAEDSGEPDAGGSGDAEAPLGMVGETEPAPS